MSLHKKADLGAARELARCRSGLWLEKSYFTTVAYRNDEPAAGQHDVQVKLLLLESGTIAAG